VDGAYCLHVTLRAMLKPLANGLTPRAVLDKFAAVQMLDVHFPTTAGRTLVLRRPRNPRTRRLVLKGRQPAMAISSVPATDAFSGSTETLAIPVG